MEDNIYKNELIDFLRLTENEQNEILQEYNSCFDLKISLLDIIPDNLNKSDLLKDFSAFLAKTKDRHEKGKDPPN